MEDHVRSVLSNKRVVLFKQLMDEIQHPDAKIADELLKDSHFADGCHPPEF